MKRVKVYGRLPVAVYAAPDCHDIDLEQNAPSSVKAGKLSAFFYFVKYMDGYFCGLRFFKSKPPHNRIRTEHNKTVY